MTPEPNAASLSERAAIVRWLRSCADAASGAESLALHRAIVGIVDGEHLAECDACTRMVPVDEISRCFAAGGVETFACDKCRNHNGGY